MSDANQVAREHARRQEHRFDPETGLRAPAQVWGRLTIWDDSGTLHQDPTFDSARVFLDLSKPGMLIAYHPDRTAEIFYPAPGWYVSFIPESDAGE